MTALALIIVGVGLFYWAHQMSGTFDLEPIRSFNSTETHGVSILYFIGAISFVVGVYSLIKKW